MTTPELVSPLDEQRIVMGERARLRAQQHLSLDDCVPHTAELLVRLAARPSLARGGNNARGL
jgi:hypothetical protein